MKYKIDWCEVKRSGTTNGRNWKITEMTLTDEQGVVHEKISTFDDVQNGTEVEGSISTNEKGYRTFIKVKDTNKKPNFDRIIEKKADMIGLAQDKKAQSIAQAQDRSAWMWAKNNASMLLANSANFKDFTELDEIADRVTVLATKIYNSEPVEPF